MANVTIVEANLDVESHRKAVTQLHDLYARDPMGLGTSLPRGHGDRLVDGLLACPTTVLYLAFRDDQPVGLAVCFVGFSTFAAKPLINVHDLIVHPAFRRQAIASTILGHITGQAQQRGYCKVTLEVRHDNEGAQSLYRKYGFGPSQPPYAFWTKPL